MTERLETVTLTMEQIARLASVMGDWNRSNQDVMEYSDQELGWLLDGAREVTVKAKRGWHPHMCVGYDNPFPGNRPDQGGSP